MNLFNDDFIDFIDYLKGHKVEYIPQTKLPLQPES